ncbi:MAG: Sialic acid synthase [Parcubacteria group bacterium Athens0714_26]|nr:MAG: Sialic acid synthase [Parcubacteria group bacterium Athens1014_26]TSD03651.1 MAG: Sialic acid synthase [Parcubacteria group bacterium Athens0714_26]
MIKQKSKKLPNRIRVGNKYIGQNEPTFFIAEIGNNHNGDYFIAKKLIEEAAKAGADAVKLQKRFIEEVCAKELLERPQTKDQIFGKTYGEYRKHLELGMEDFIKLKKVAEDLGLIFFATPFDKKSVDFLEEIGVDLYKIASFDNTNIPLLEYVAQKGKPVILSSGMTSLEEFDEAVETILKYNSQLIIKHCVSIYPTPDEKFNLMTIPFLKERYGLPVGYSGHEQDILPSLAAIVLGANSVERHITLDKLMPGPDHGTVSIEPKEFRAMVDGARRLEKALGVSTKQCFTEEMVMRKKHAKSLVSKVLIPKGTAVTADMVHCKSPGYGLKPNKISFLIGKKAKINIEPDTVIKSEDIVWEV